VNRGFFYTTKTMAENKKSFIAYADWKNTFDELPNEEAGKLIKHIFAYVNDENPVSESILINAVFANIKTTLKRDLNAWEKTLEIKSDSGKMGNLKRWHKDLYLQVIENKINIDEALVIAQHRKTSHTDNLPSHPIAKIAVNVNDSVNDNVNVNTNNIESRKLKFANSLKVYLDIYGKDTLNDFYRYWSESNKSNTKFKMELERTWDTKGRLETWIKRDKQFSKTLNEPIQPKLKEFK